MGLRAGLTYHFNISRKLRLQDPLKITDEYTTINKRVSKWIEDDPLLLWHLIYDKSVKKSCSLSLCRDALAVLKERIKVLKPELLEEVSRRRVCHSRTAQLSRVTGT